MSNIFSAQIRTYTKSFPVQIIPGTFKLTCSHFFSIVHYLHTRQICAIKWQQELQMRFHSNYFEV